MGIKIIKVLMAVIAFLCIAVLTGLIVTGTVIGWGPFAFIKYNKSRYAWRKKSKNIRLRIYG